MTCRTIAGGSVITIMAMVIMILIKKQHKNKRLFQELMAEDTSIKHKVTPVLKPKTDMEQRTKDTEKLVTPEISQEIEENILKKLERLEQSKKYLEKDMTLHKMAAILNTNTKYVTKIIAKHRGKGTIEYITDLKINYVIEMLKKENKYRNYTNKALSEEVGFGSPQNFTKAFKARTGISPTYFIYQLNKAANTSI